MKILCDEIGKETSEAVPSRDGGDGNKPRPFLPEMEGMETKQFLRKADL